MPTRFTGELMEIHFPLTMRVLLSFPLSFFFDYTTMSEKSQELFLINDYKYLKNKLLLILKKILSKPPPVLA